MSFLIFLCCVPAVVCFAVFLYAARFAPEGFEDEAGFFLDQPRRRDAAREAGVRGQYRLFLR